MTFKGFCIFTAGMLAGGAAGWFASKYYYDKKAQEVVTTGADIFDQFVEKMNKEKEEAQQNIEEAGDGSEENLDDDVPTSTALIDSFKEFRNEHFDYGKPEEFSESVEEPMPHVTTKAQEPYIISELQWADSNGYEKIELVYYETDEVLATYENGIYDYRETGQIFCENFDDDTDIVYVRNDSYSRDFEITRDPRSFNEVATGGF